MTSRRGVPKILSRLAVPTSVVGRPPQRRAEEARTPGLLPPAPGGPYVHRHGDPWREPELVEGAL